MSHLLQDPRYGTPLFETFILPAEAAATAPSGLLKSNVVALQSSIEEDNSRCTSYTSLTVALQSAQRAMNEMLRVVPVRKPSSSSSDQLGVRLTNQRIMLLIDSSTGKATAAAVNAGSDSTLLVWTTELHSLETTTAAATAVAEATAASQGNVAGPFRPAESGSGALKVTFTLDW